MLLLFLKFCGGLNDLVIHIIYAKYCIQSKLAAIQFRALKTKLKLLECSVELTSLIINDFAMIYIKAHEEQFTGGIGNRAPVCCGKARNIYARCILIVQNVYAMHL